MKFKLVEKLYYTDENENFQIYDEEMESGIWWLVYRCHKEKGTLGFITKFKTLEEAKKFVVNYKE